MGIEPDWLMRGLPNPNVAPTQPVNEPTFPGTTTPIGNIARSALSNYSDYRNSLGIPRIGNTRVADLMRGRAERTAEGEIDRYTGIRNKLGAPRLQDTELAKIINRTLTNPEESPGFKLGQNMLNQSRTTQRENLNTILEKSGLAASPSGIGIKALNMLNRQGDVEMGNLALTEGSNAINRSMQFQPMVENAFNTELDRGLGAEQQGVTDLYNLERSSQGDFQNELGKALSQEELAKKRDLQTKLQDMKNQGALGGAAGDLLSKALPQILQALGLGIAPNAIEQQLGLPAGTLLSLLGKTVGAAGGALGGLIGSGVKGLGSLFGGLFGGGDGGGDFVPDPWGTQPGDLSGIGPDPTGGTGGDFTPDPWGTGAGDLDWLSGGGGDFVPDTWGAEAGDLDWLSNFSNASTGAAGVGAEAAAGFGEFTPEILEGIEAGYGGMVGAGGSGLGGLASLATPFGIVGGGLALGKLMAKLFGFESGGRKWEEKAAGWQDEYAGKIKANPQAWVQEFENAYGPEGKQAAIEALQGKLTPQRVKELFGFADIPEFFQNFSLGQNKKYGNLSQAVALEGSRGELSNFKNLAPSYQAARAQPPIDLTQDIETGTWGNVFGRDDVTKGRGVTLPPGWELTGSKDPWEAIRRVQGE